MLKKFALGFKNHCHNYWMLCVLGLVIISAFINWACSSVHPVPIIGEEADLALLAGEWVGEYNSTVTSRSGTIVFKLTAGEDTAYGEVIMTPRGSKQPYRSANYQSDEGVPPPRSQWLTISFVKVARGKVRGKLTPYWDPDFRRTLLTSFEGKLKGDIIEGTFISRIEKSEDYYTGAWKAIRRKK